MISYSGYIKSLSAKGKRYFLFKEAMEDLSVSNGTLRKGLSGLMKKGVIASPAMGLYIIIPPEDYNRGCISPDELVVILAKYWNMNYYVGLLSAGDYYGAAHQKPQIFQVITERRRKNKILQCGKVRIEFLFKKSVAGIATRSYTTHMGEIKVASPEVLAMDLLLYPRRSGGLNNIATVLSELLEELDSTELLKLIARSEKAVWIQRLGYILANISSFEEEKKAVIINELSDIIREKNFSYSPLSPHLPVKGHPYNKQFRLIENDLIDSDL